ncbi:GLPGLI family protein [Ornithobacterium rhinotracheale]|uniref:GLPGLI family protein n=1 Tax=Ornithobacterium rhinotracheale TaxID=28251 RepID=UPI00129C8C59|nr:GLPGLI family protein [Ornithobacterium rhinotracheale]MRI63777.1 GLPGLI family protein [Ornithobacterium rhinotracheale]MRJ09679.1 GLPGLI family protein [Ornithobacterium rhinotracheale]
MKKLLLLSTFLISAISFAQPVVTGDVSLPADPYNETDLGNSNQNIYYTYTRVPNPELKEKTKTGLTVLQIGKDFTKFTDEAIIKSDSLSKAFAQKGTANTSDLNKMLAVMYGTGYFSNVLNDLKTKQITIQNAMMLSGMEYTIPTPTLKWQLQKDQKEILGYAVQKATTQYGGREWEAWFAKDIPLSYGPYVFNGLPGLILEVYDTENEHHFTATGMDNKPQAIYKRIYDKEIKTSAEKAKKALKNEYENGKRPRPYNPIEKS